MATSEQIAVADRPDHYRPWGLIRGDIARAAQHLYSAYSDDDQARERRERVKAAMTCILYDAAPSDLLDAIGATPDEIAMAVKIAAQLPFREVDL